MITKRLFLQTAFSASLTACAHVQSKPDAQPRPLIVDVDTGRDDAWALLGALDRFEVAAIIASYGNTTLANAERNSSGVLRLGQIHSPHISQAERRLPVLGGSAAPLPGAPASALAEIARRAHVNGNGICNVVIPATSLPHGAADLFHGFDALLAKHERLDYIACGPLTNLARLIDHYEAKGISLKNRIGIVSIMGGSISPDLPVDFNFRADPNAVKRVLTYFGEQIRLFPSDETRKLRLGKLEVQALKPNTPLAAFNKEVMLAYLEGWSPDNALLLHDPSTLLAFEAGTPYRHERVSITAEGKLVQDHGGTPLLRFTVPAGAETQVTDRLLTHYMGLKR